MIHWGYAFKRRGIVLVVMLSALVCFFSPAASALQADPAAFMAEAEAVTAGVSVTLSDGQAGGALLDQNRGTSLALSGGTVTIQSEQPFLHVYFIWDTPPSAYRLAAFPGGQDIALGAGGFLHEAATLSAPATQAVLQLSDADYTLCDIYLFTGGALPGWVQQWQPVLEKADLLALPTHADDEHLFFGGILPTYAGERGLAVQVVYMTNHWGERYRPHELLDGLWTVGVTAYPVMGPFPDLYASLESFESAEALYGYQQALDFQVETLRRFRPEVVVGHDLNGEYGHGAHILNARTLLEALELAGDAEYHPESASLYGTWEVPKAYLHLYGENQLVMDWDTPLERFGGATAYEMAVAGFAKHLSQQGYFEVRQDGTWEDCRRFGLVRSLVGPDVAQDDLFENIELAPEPEPVPEPEPPDEAAGSDARPAPPPAADASAGIQVSPGPGSDNTEGVFAPAAFLSRVPVTVWAAVGAFAAAAIGFLICRAVRARR